MAPPAHLAASASSPPMASILRSLPPPDLPSPPFHPTLSIPNLRDIGGYPLAHPPSPAARSIRRGLVFRSADPSAGDHAALRDALHVSRVFDLRSDVEVQAAHFGPAMDHVAGIQRTWAPTNREDMSPEALALRYAGYRAVGDDGFVRAYADILASAGPAVKVVVEHLASMRDRVLAGEPDAVLIHCTAGKDRTAVVTMLLLALAGCSADTIAREYALTQRGLDQMRPLLVERLLRRPEMHDDRDGVVRMTGSRYEVMPKVLRILHEKWGGARNYLIHECQLTDAVLDAVRDVLCSSHAPIFDPQGRLLAAAAAAATAAADGKL